MPNFDEFLKDCNTKYNNKYCPELEKQYISAINSAQDKDNVFTDLASRIGASSKVCLFASNYISLNHLHAYHNWLFENYDIKPKSQKA